MGKEIRPLIFTWLGLMALLALTVASTFAPIGALKPVVNLAIAFAKAGLIFWMFMHLREQKWLIRIMALAALVWLAILAAMTHADLLTRAWSR